MNIRHLIWKWKDDGEELIIDGRFYFKYQGFSEDFGFGAIEAFVGPLFRLFTGLIV